MDLVSAKAMHEWVELLHEPRPSFMKFQCLAVFKLSSTICWCIKLLTLLQHVLVHSEVVHRNANIEVQACCNHSGVTWNAALATAINYGTRLAL